LAAKARLGVIAAGHPTTAQAGASVLREGGNAVDAAVGAMLAAFACEPLLTALGAGGYMLVVPPGGEPVLLDFFVEASGRGADPAARAELIPISVSFGDAIQVFNIGAASVGTYGLPAGLAEASARFGRMTLADLVGPAAALARNGVVLNEQQAYVVKILGDIVLSTPESAALFAPEGRLLGAGDVVRQPELGDALERLGADGPEPFYTGDIGDAIVSWVGRHGGDLTAADLAAYRVIDRAPVATGYRGRDVITNPPPSAGGILIARALSLLEGDPAAPDNERLVNVMEVTQALRTSEFLEGLDDPAFVERFLRGDGGGSGAGGSGGRGSRGGSSGAGGSVGPLGSTTHISVIDRDGWACGVTCSNGSCSGVVVPGTGVHLNNMAGEQDLNPLGFHRHPPGRRMPSMMAPTIVMRAGRPELVLGSAGSNRIRSAILQTIVRVIDDGLRAPDAVRAPRVHFEDGVVYAEPGAPTGRLEAAGRALARFRELNLFFGGVQAVERDAAGAFWGGGDPRRGGAAVVVEGRG
jgi:gamma-glutamyltranspeptidase / glutathione hydrolase